jgi:hypothetical protein
MPPSLARELFDRILAPADKILYLRGLINSTPPTFETDWLDFKTEPPNPQTWDKQIREMWCEAISGFGNNQGGVLVWGIIARKTEINGVEIDTAVGERLVNNPTALKSRLTELQRGATDPPLANIEIEALEVPAAPGTGFVACYIPEGPFKPYRTEEGRRSQFYLRAGDNTVPMSRAVIQALFYPRSQAYFKIDARLSWAHDDRSAQFETQANMTLVVGVANAGTATAKDVIVRVDHNLGSGKNIGPVSASPPWFLREGCFVYPCPLHPFMPSSQVFVWQWTIRTASSPATEYELLPRCANPAFSFSIYCENQEPQQFAVEFDVASMRKEATFFHGNTRQI